jgi:hypothetical protein
MSTNTEASEAINETYKYCSGKIFHLREYVNFNFSFFQALVAARHAKTRTFRFLANYAPNFGAYIISARQRSLAQHTNFPVWLILFLLNSIEGLKFIGTKRITKS